MAVNLTKTHTLNDLDESILVASEMMAIGDHGAITSYLVTAVQLIDVSRMEYAKLLEICSSSRMVIPKLRDVVRSMAMDSLKDVLRPARYSSRKIYERIKSLTELELLSGDRTLIGLTNEGKRLVKAIRNGRVPLVRPPKKEQVTVFFAGAFGRDDVDLLYNEELMPACEEFHFSLYRVDLDEPIQTITNSILLGIQQSACILADLTYARPSVYFEIGMAHDLGMPLVLLCRSDHQLSSDDGLKIHFDLAQFKISFWTIAPTGSFSWPKLMHPVERLRAVLGEKEVGS